MSPQKPAAIVKSSADASPVSLAWQAYSNAYAKRYGPLPTPSASMNGKLAQLVAQLGKEDAPKVAAFYLSHGAAYYKQRMHPVGLLLADCQKLRTEMLTGRSVNAEVTRQEERTDANPALQYLDELRRKKDETK